MQSKKVGSLVKLLYFLVEQVSSPNALIFGFFLGISSGAISSIVMVLVLSLFLILLNWIAQSLESNSSPHFATSTLSIVHCSFSTRRPHLHLIALIHQVNLIQGFKQVEQAIWAQWMYNLHTMSQGDIWPVRELLTRFVPFRLSIIDKVREIAVENGDLSRWMQCNCE